MSDDQSNVQAAVELEALRVGFLTEIKKHLDEGWSWSVSLRRSGCDYANKNYGLMVDDPRFKALRESCRIVKRGFG